LRSKVWNNYRRYLLFQIQYIKPKYWARTPLILAVTGGYSNNLIVSKELNQKYQTKNINFLAQKFDKAFTGYSPKDFLIWMTNYYRIIDYWKDELKEKSEHVSAIAEIGPGFLPLACQSLFPDFREKFYSYDTFEMQLLQEKIACEVLGSASGMEFVPTNLSLDGDKMLRVPSESYCVYALWSFTEIEIQDRNRFMQLIKNAEYSIIVSNILFEGTNNHEYLVEMALKLDKRVLSVPLLDVLGSEIPNFMKQHKIFLFI
jgi:hypothetical protein